MSETITIDFETRSEVDLKASGPWVYAEHESTEILCMAYKLENSTGETTGTMIAVPEKFWVETTELQLSSPSYMISVANIVNSHRLFEAHNAEFERAIWHHICHKRWGWPDIPIERWRCSAAKAAALSLPRSLGNAGAALGLSAQKDTGGRALMLKMCKPRRPLKKEKTEWLQDQYDMTRMNTKEFTKSEFEFAEQNMPPLWHETSEQLIRLFQYCIQDVEAEYELSQNLRDLSPKEQKLWFIDQKINTRGIKTDLESAQAAVEIIELHEEKMLEEFIEITNGKVASPKKIEAFRNWLIDQGTELPNLQKATVEEALATDITGIVRRALEIRQSLSKSSTAKFKKILSGTNLDGRARGLVMFHGAHPGRWAGKRIQLQNLVRSLFKDVGSCLEVIRSKNTALLEMLWGDPMKAMASCMRGMLVSDEGKDFLCADFSMIEMCVNNWLVKAEEKLGAIRSGEPIYKLTAASIYKILPTDVTPKQRQVGKVAELALGYQGGVKAFQKMAPGYGVEIADDFAEEIKIKWRRANPKIVRFWHNIEMIVIRAIKTGKAFNCNGTTWGVHGDYLFCKLPSGRLMAYYKPELRMKLTPWGEPKEMVTYMGVDSVTTRWTRISTYGGKLVENVVQAIARDLLAEAMVRIEEAGYPIVLHVHDEVVSEVSEGFGSLKAFEELMAVTPEWAKGCPISAEGWRGKRYKK